MELPRCGASPPGAISPTTTSNATTGLSVHAWNDYSGRIFNLEINGFKRDADEGHRVRPPQTRECGKAEATDRGGYRVSLATSGVGCPPAAPLLYPQKAARGKACRAGRRSRR
jgi:hypothetical protein